MMARKDAVVKGLTDGVAELFKRRGVTRYAGTARFVAPGELAVAGAEGEQRLAARRVIIATGSRAGALAGVELDGDRIATSTEALAWSEVPGQLVVIGAGAIGLELGSVWLRLGSQVTVLEYLDRVLPGMDLEIARETQRLLKRQGLSFKLSARVTGAKLVNRRPEVTLEGGETFRCDRVLLATGRVPNTEGLGLDAIGLATDERGRIPVGADFATSVAGRLRHRRRDRRAHARPQGRGGGRRLRGGDGRPPRAPQLRHDPGRGLHAPRGGGRGQDGGGAQGARARPTRRASSTSGPTAARGRWPRSTAA